MNKDIQTLIEKEAEKYADSKGIYNQHGEDLLKMGFNKGASFALSLFKWRKVSEVLPEQDKYKLSNHSVDVIGSKNNDHSSYYPFFVYYDYDSKAWFSHMSLEPLKLTEWMPIPQID